MIDIIPAIIPESLTDISDAVARVSGLVSTVQVDLVDGAFAPPKTWPYMKMPDADFELLLKEENGLPEWEQMNYEIDMMVAEPEKKIDDWIKVGISSAIFHIESTKRLAEAIEKARYFDVKVGLALKPSTPTDLLYEWIEEIDFVQFMGNDKIGYHGVEFDRKVLKKIRELRKEFADIAIGVDIGVDEETAPDMVAAGATRLVSGSTLFDSTDIEGMIDFYQNLG